MKKEKRVIRSCIAARTNNKSTRLGAYCYVICGKNTNIIISWWPYSFFPAQVPVRCRSYFTTSCMHSTVIIQTRYFCHHSSIHFTTSHPRILVTTPSTFVLASLNSINCPSLTNSDWLMNSKTTLALSPVLMRPEG